MKKIVIDASEPTKAGKRRKSTRTLSATEVSARNKEVSKAREQRKAPEKIKAETGRRIFGMSVEHDQRNKIARGVELLSKQVDAIIAHLGIPDPLSASELAEKNAYLALWANIKSLRAKSNDIEAMDPVPDDFTDDKYWT